MTETQTKPMIQDVVAEAINHHGTHPDALIPILAKVNRAYGYIPAEAIREVKARLHLPDDRVFVHESQLFSIASFYHMLSTKPRGRHVVLFCESAPCHVMGGRELWKSLREELQLQAGETSPDGKWSLVTTSCLGACGVGPVMVVDDDMYGNVTPAMVSGILGKYA